jgi:LytS/YehU family sensor histidine kinase
MEKTSLSIELAFLKSQINPHFLFNTLNTIYILAYQQSVQTPDAILKMSDMMRYMLYESNEERVPLSKEIYYIRQLMALQQLRMKDPMCFDFSVTGEVENYRVAPLILVNFAENIFKHAVLNDESNPAIMHLKLEGEQLSLYSRNRINNALKDDEGGIGLANVKRRMELIYPHRHHFKIESDAIYYNSYLTIQFD